MTTKLKNFITLAAPFFIITAVSVGALGALYAATQVKYDKLKREAGLFNETIASLQRRVDMLLKDKEITDSKVLNVVQWQFVLKDQIGEANQRLWDSVSRITDLKNNSALLNLLYYNLGLNYTMAVDFDGAIETFEKALEFKPSDAQTCYILGLLYSVNLKDADKAVEYYKKYLRLAPGAANVEEVRGKIEALAKR